MKAEISAFLRSRRLKVDPTRVGLPAPTSRRRNPGLTRSEVSVLARISRQYYIQIEQGNLFGVSDQILEAIADALLLPPPDRWHLFGLARLDQDVLSAERSHIEIDLRTKQLVDSIGLPAFILRRGGDILARNALAHATFTPMFESLIQPANHAIFTFLDPAARDFFVDWEAEADVTAAALHEELALSADREPALSTINTLIDQSPEYVARRRDYPVGISTARTIRISHPQLGGLEFFNHRLVMLQLDKHPLLLVRAPVPDTGTAEVISRLKAAGRATDRASEEPAMSALAGQDPRQA